MINILYEDNDIIVVEKPAGIAVQSKSIAQEDMVSCLKNYLCRKKKLTDPYIGVIHRLDQPVRGIVVFALNKNAAAGLSRKLNSGSFCKRYRAMVEGIADTEGEQVVLINYLIKDRDGIARISDKDNKAAKRSELKFRTVRVNEADEFSVLDIELITGRYHQIRAQMAGTGHPIVNDVKYGAKKGKTGKNVTGIELCAYSLSFDHPVSGRRMEFTLDPDE